jgi:hypothetical protein
MAETVQPLIDLVGIMCKELADREPGWQRLLAHHGLDVRATDLRRELSRELPNIDRTVPGFEDFALEGRRGIEPGQPARSLLFHALASPRVLSDPEGRPLALFPIPAQLDALENYVFGTQPPSLQDLRVRADDAPIAMVVFAYEYRAALGTVHQKHADMCFSRTGIARVGTHPEKYDGASRAYLPLVEDNPRALRVLPCRYAAFVAAQYKGDKDGFGPVRFRTADTDPNSRGDDERDFWVPLHKLFSGPECIHGRTLVIGLSAYHENQKLRRIHLALRARGHESWTAPAIDQPPFVLTSGLAGLSPLAGGGAVLRPVPHDPLVAPAEYGGAPLTYVVPPDAHFSSSLYLESGPHGERSAPEYVHARHQLDDHGFEVNLNRAPDVIARVVRGGYRARHYVDFTADGVIAADCPELVLDLPRRIAGYSLIAPPDFYPFVKQQDLMDWWEQSVPPDVHDTIWPDNPGAPEPLSDNRLPANLNLPGARFAAADDTITAIVAMRGAGRDRPARITPPLLPRVSSLPDRAAGVFAPGWDCSIDRTPDQAPTGGAESASPGTTHLAAYGLGSPFPEDAKLCAALSSYWPAAAPDITRAFEPGGAYAVTTPLTDEALGLTGGPPPWDGIAGPVMAAPAFPNEVEFSAFAYGDWVEAALENRFSFARIAGLSTADYEARTLIMARVYEVLGAKSTKAKAAWCLLSFAAATDYAQELQAAEVASGRTLAAAHAYRFVMFQHRGARTHPQRFDKILVRFDSLVTLFADPRRVLLGNGGGRWQLHEFPL